AFFVVLVRCAPGSPLFPYTTLFRSARLSGGERARIAIARALLKGADIVILDEATAALDPIAESTLKDAIASLAGRCTVILITHRSEEHTSELQSRENLVCRLLLEKK